ncbi:MAG: DUF4364 family protein [Lachnospiraceae bacterium]|nr:DUF4364 family protein [Lachnospiraceae bacterium]
MQDSNTLCKLIILFMLRKVSFPLTNAQLTEFIVGKEYTDYFHVQESINDLLDAHLISSEKIRNTSQYTATMDGEKTLEYFRYMISENIKNDIAEYMDENALELRTESCTKADYRMTPNHEYEVRCYVREGSEMLIDLRFSVPGEEEAEKVCANWPEKSQKIYMNVLTELL